MEKKSFVTDGIIIRQDERFRCVKAYLLLQVVNLCSDVDHSNLHLVQLMCRAFLP